MKKTNFTLEEIISRRAFKIASKAREVRNLFPIHDEIGRVRQQIEKGKKYYAIGRFRVNAGNYLMTLYGYLNGNFFSYS